MFIPVFTKGTGVGIFMYYIQMYLNRFVVSHRCHNSSCSGCGSPCSGAIVQHSSGNPQEESALLQGGVVQTAVTHVPKYRKVPLSCGNSHVPCILIFLIMCGFASSASMNYVCVTKIINMMCMKSNEVFYNRKKTYSKHTIICSRHD